MPIRINRKCWYLRVLMMVLVVVAIDFLEQ